MAKKRATKEPRVSELASIPDLAKEFGYDRRHLSKLAKNGTIKAWKFGHTWVTTRSLIERYIKSNPKPGLKRSSFRSLPKR
ncbi:MAG: hypothetical protein AAB288_05405 [Acidobacteriota bacterium]